MVTCPSMTCEALLSTAMTPLCLPPATGKLPEGGLVISSAAAPQRRDIEHAGFSYQERLRGRYNIQDEVQNSKKESDPGEKEEMQYGTSSMHELEKAMFKDSDDYYSLLELGHKRWRATEDEIRKNFRKLSLKYHPDKVAHLGEDAIADADEHFKKIVKANDVLSDRKKRAAYDSIDDVDDSIPLASSITGKNFYSTLGPCFELNARWSSSKRVPKLGDDGTPIETVYKFYDFWYSFKTWRDFSFDLEHDTEQAESREERRWMERQNAKHIKARKLAEATRIRTLVDMAFNNDPRIARERAKDRAAKKAALEEKQRRRQEALTAKLAAKEKEERERIAVEEKKREEKAKLKREREMMRRITRKARQRLRGTAGSLQLLSHEEIMLKIERICLEASAEDINICSGFLEQLRKDDATLMREVEAILAKSLKTIDDKRKGREEAGDGDTGATTSTISKSNVSFPPSSKEWSAGETATLQKALLKYPAGTVDRWIKVAEQLEGRSADEVRRVAHMMKFGGGRKRSKAGKASPVSGFSSRSPSKSAFGKQANGSSGKDTAVQNGSISNGCSGREKTTQESGGLKIGDGPPNSMNFVKRQQMALEAGLKKFPATIGESRWVKIAEKVPGRSPEECRARFLELAAFFKSKKTAKK